MTRPKDNDFAPTVDRLDDFLRHVRDRNHWVRLVCESEEIMITQSCLEQLIAQHRELKSRIRAFRAAFQDLMGAAG